MPLLAMLLAWLVPGAGHAYLGRWKRGIVIFITIGSLFWAGSAIGGKLTMDYHGERWWFMAQMLTGAHGAAAWQRQNEVYQQAVQGKPRLSGQELSAKMAEMGYAMSPPGDGIARAYSGIAGLLNLMCIFDAIMLSLMNVTGEPRREELAAPAEGQS